MDRPCWDFCSEPRLDCRFMEGALVARVCIPWKGQRQSRAWGLAPQKHAEPHPPLPRWVIWGCELVAGLQGATVRASILPQCCV